MATPKKELAAKAQKELLEILEARFVKHKKRHKGLAWDDVHAVLRKKPAKLWSLNEMERTGGEPDVIGAADTSGAFLFVDCVAESPKGRRSVCYDPAALASRKEHKPAHSAVGMAAEMGIDLLNEEQYRTLQSFGPVDTKTSSWLHTPDDIRALGGALFGDWRYGHTFLYHNGAESYYGARGFRGLLRV